MLLLGGKTSQILSITDNKAFVTACEKNKIRFDRLKYNLEKQGARNYNLMKEDSRNLDEFFRFDKILLDSPCSRKWNRKYISREFFRRLIRKNCKSSRSTSKKSN